MCHSSATVTTIHLYGLSRSSMASLPRNRVFMTRRKDRHMIEEAGEFGSFVGSRL